MSKNETIIPNGFLKKFMGVPAIYPITLCKTGKKLAKNHLEFPKQLFVLFSAAQIKFDIHEKFVVINNFQGEVR